MPTSKKTNEQIIKVLDEHLTYHEQKALFADLAKVKGNGSFAKSIQALAKLILARWS